MTNEKTTTITLTDKEIQNLKAHPLANLFPMIVGEAKNDFKASLLANGVREPITIMRDKATGELKILDGRNRHAVGLEVGASLQFVEFNGTDEEALHYVLDLNVARRHLNESQRAMVAASLVNTKRGDNQHTTIVGCSYSQGKAAKMTNTSPESVRRAVIVTEKGCLELNKAVKSGTLAVSKAAGIAQESPVHQKQILEKLQQAASSKKTRKKADNNGQKPDKKFTLIFTAAEMELINAIILIEKPEGSEENDAFFIKDFVLSYCEETAMDKLPGVEVLKLIELKANDPARSPSYLSN